MTWVKLTDDFAQHPKIVEAGPIASALHVAALCHSNRHLTDGFIARRVPRVLLDLSEVEIVSDGVPVVGQVHVEQLVERLEHAGLWEWSEEREGWVIHDYHDFQPSREQVERDRQALSEKRAAAGRRGAKARWTGDSDGKHGKPMASGVANEWQADGKRMAPYPTRSPQTPQTPRKRGANKGVCGEEPTTDWARAHLKALEGGDAA